MVQELDRREQYAAQMTSTRQAELQARAAAVSDRLPGAHRVRIRRYDPLTGNPAAVTSTSAPAERGNYVQRALDHVRGISAALGFAPVQPVEFTADPTVDQASSGAVAVHLQQLYKGIPIFQAAETVRFAPDGVLQETVGSSVTVGREVPVTPRLSVEDAVLRAARHVTTPARDEGATDVFGQPLTPPRIDLTGFEPRVSAAFAEKPERPTVLEAGPFGDQIKARLVWFPLGEQLRLTWEALITMPDFAAQYRTLVDAESGEVLYCRQLVQSVAARGNVFRVDGGSARQMTEFPRALADYSVPIPGDLPATFPDDWVTLDRTVGNSVNAHRGSTGPSVPGAVQGGVLTFDAGEPGGVDQQVVNVFYFNCFLHDLFYMLGFRETSGNFQHDNFGRGGVASDRVDARAHPGVVQGTANMATPSDGQAPIMNMGLVALTNRHTALDASVVFHEFTHGVTNRLVGGPANVWALDAHQSAGMGEGWSDYVACTVNGTTVVGDWVTNNPTGIRDFRYDEQFPDDFGDLGTGRYSGFLPDGRRAPHPIGEIWCATLLQMNRNIGATLGLQLVVDALKLTPANPSFLDARDAILAALDAKLTAGQLTATQHADARRGSWQAFARFGMGPNAQSNGAFLSGIVADFNTPPEQQPQPSAPGVSVEATPNLAVPDNAAAGVSSALTVSQPGRIGRVAVAVDIAHSFVGDLRVGLTVPGGGTALLHDRSGGSAHDLVTTYRSDDTPALAPLIGQNAQGTWTLHVSDRAALDTGTLRRWRLDLDLQAGSQILQGEAAPGLTIPDNDATGVSSPIAVAKSGAAQAVKVDVDITHTFVGDLRVELVAPAGQVAVLHDQSGGSADNLIRSYDSSGTAALASMVGQPVEGMWQLRVKDLVGQDVGKLNRWRLELTI